MKTYRQELLDKDDYEKRIAKIFTPVFIFTLIIMIIGFCLSFFYKTEFINNNLSKEDFFDYQVKIVIFIVGLGIIFPIFYILYQGIKLKIEESGWIR